MHTGLEPASQSILALLLIVPTPVAHLPPTRDAVPVGIGVPRIHRQGECRESVHHQPWGARRRTARGRPMRANALEPRHSAFCPRGSAAAW